MKNDRTKKELNKLVQICHANLKNSEECMSYLKEKRGLSDEDISRNKIGYFPRNVSKLLRYVSKDELERSKIVDFSGYSHFSEFYYLIFPILSEYGDPIGIGGRTLLTDNERTVIEIPKYKNSSFNKNNVLYGLNHSRSSIVKKRNVYVLEGYFDQVSMERYFHNSVAICGTAFSRKHFLKLTRYTDKITFLLDNDDSGRLAMERIYSRFSNYGIKLRFLALPNGCKDIDEYFSKGGGQISFEKDLESFIPGW